MTTNKSSSAPAKGSPRGLSATRQQFAQKSGNDLVTVQNWQALYGRNGLSVSCTVKARKTGGVITSVGLLAYSADRKTSYCSQFTADTSSNSVGPSVATEGFNLQGVKKIVGVVFGYIERVEFFFEQELTLKASSPPTANKVGAKAASTPAQRSSKKASAKKGAK